MPTHNKILITVPTAKEQAIISASSALHDSRFLVCGAGPALPAMQLALYLTEHDIDLVILAGIAGCYTEMTNILDIIYAESEVFGDTGRCGEDNISAIALSEKELPTYFDLSTYLPETVLHALEECDISRGGMVTVSCVSAATSTAARIRKRFPDAVCENMEGASVAMVCRHFNIPLLELRSVSNVAGDPDRQNWRVSDALEAVGHKVNILLEKISK